MKHLLRHRWTLTLVFLMVFAISGCGQKSDNASNSGGGDTTSTTTASPGGETSPSSGEASPSSGKTITKTVSPEAQKLGVAPQGERNCPKNAPIKGVITGKRGNIYRGPKSPDYARVKPKICFADEATAEKAGYKAPTK